MKYQWSLLVLILVATTLAQDPAVRHQGKGRCAVAGGRCTSLKHKICLTFLPGKFCGARRGCCVRMKGDPEPAPVEAEPALVEGEAAPVEDEAAPVEGEAAPVEGEAAPVEGEAAPVEGEAAPVEAEPAPEEP